MPARSVIFWANSLVNEIKKLRFVLQWGCNAKLP